MIWAYMSNGLNLLHPRKDVFSVSLIVPEDLVFAIKSGKHVYQESSFLCPDILEQLHQDIDTWYYHETLGNACVPSQQNADHLWRLKTAPQEPEGKDIVGKGKNRRDTPTVDGTTDTLFFGPDPSHFFAEQYSELSLKHCKEKRWRQTL